jgi:hypothetical protein
VYSVTNIPHKTTGKCWLFKETYWAQDIVQSVFSSDVSLFNKNEWLTKHDVW